MLKQFQPFAPSFIDFYKADHRRQYPDGTEMVMSNWTPRSVAHAPKVAGIDNKIVNFGIQYAIKYFLCDMWNMFFAMPKAQAVAKYKRRLDRSLGPDAVPMDHLEALHDLGYLPLSVRALPEGASVPARVAMATFENTDWTSEDPRFFWLTNYIESAMSCLLWQPCTSATQARLYRILLERAAWQTGADRSFVKFQAHDFSFRGMGGFDSAMASGGAHLAYFVGTDTVPALDWLEYYYNGDADKELLGCSVPATEHSVMCMGTMDGEFETFKRLITELYPKGFVSIVSDTWDYFQVLTQFLPRLKKEIMARDGKVVIRPDSGDPVKIICGDPDAPVGSPEYKGSVELLWEIFGGTTTPGGYRVLDSHIGLIYGDSITHARAEQITRLLREKKFASTNVVFGVGSFTYQYVTRDTFGFAVKATAGRVKGQDREIFKAPKTDGGMKKSARGLIAVVKNERGEYEQRDQVSRQLFENCELREVFRNGKLLIDESIATIRARVDEEIEREICALQAAKLQS